MTQVWIPLGIINTIKLEHKMPKILPGIFILCYSFIVYFYTQLVGGIFYWSATELFTTGPKNVPNVFKKSWFVHIVKPILAMIPTEENKSYAKVAITSGYKNTLTPLPSTWAVFAYNCEKKTSSSEILKLFLPCLLALLNKTSNRWDSYNFKCA